MLRERSAPAYRLCRVQLSTTPRGDRERARASAQAFSPIQFNH
jgi:hypothetical protein